MTPYYCSEVLYNHCMRNQSKPNVAGDGIRYVDYSSGLQITSEGLVEKYLIDQQAKLDKTALGITFNDEGDWAFRVRRYEEKGWFAIFGVDYAEALYGVSYLELLDRIKEGGGEWVYD